MPDTLLEFKRDLYAYLKMGGEVTEEHPMLGDGNCSYVTDGQYTLMNRWAMEKIAIANPPVHIDIASQLAFAAYLSLSREVKFVDLRDPGIKAPWLRYVKGDITKLPMEDGSTISLSCLHVAEHIGLGRYGDTIDPEGFNIACSELARVLSRGGNLYFAVPCGIPRVQFNELRVLGHFQVIEAFRGLKLLDFSAMTSSGVFMEHAAEDALSSDPYGVGMFHFTKDD